ncbi:MAG: HyaD/HybD family hydrogenase maturation endopeptidase [Anaerolineae bacterium]
MPSARPKRPSILVLGLGNTLLSDEGLGVQALERLHASLGDARTDIAWLDGGTMGLEALPYIEEASHLLILDAIQTGDPPGALVCLQDDAIPAAIARKLSMHQVALADALAMAALRGTLPTRRVLLGITPAELDWGLTLSEVVSAQMDDLVAAAAGVLATWGSAQDAVLADAPAGGNGDSG